MEGLKLYEISQGMIDTLDIFLESDGNDLDKEYDRIYETFNEIREKNDLKNLLYYNEISDEIDNICNKYI